MESAPVSEGKQIVRGTAIVSLLTLLSRVFGFVRELLTARLLGAGFFSDAFFVAFRLPNLLRSFVAEGALTSAFVPMFAERLHKGEAEAQRTLNIVGGFLLLFTGALSLLGMMYAQELVALFGFSDDKSELCATLTRIMFPYIMLVSIVALLNGALNSLKVYGTAAWAQILTNIVLIVGAAVGFLFPTATAAKILAWSLLLGGVVGVLYQLPALRRAKMTFRPHFVVRSSDLLQLLKLMLPAIFGAAAYQISIFMATVFASVLREGSVSWLFYADRLAQLPIGVFTVALGTVLLPSLSMSFSKNDHKAFASNFSRALSFTSVLILPVAAMLLLFAEPLIVAIFEGGRFTHESSVQSAAALRAMTFGLWGASCHSIVIRAFLAQRNTVTPAVLGFVSLCVGALGSVILMGPPAVTSQSEASIILSAQAALGSFLPLASLGHVGLALASSISTIFSFIVVYWLLTRQVKGLAAGEFFIASLKALVAATCSMFLLLATDLFSMQVWLQLLLGIPLFFVIYALIGLVLGLSEIRETLAVVQERVISRFVPTK